MRLIGLTVENFRCYGDPISVRFDDLTALVGRNDVGKSTLMDALSIFFETAKPDRDDACKTGDPKKMRITCEFDRLPDTLTVDTDYPTTLADEFLLCDAGTLVIRKTYDGTQKTPPAKVIEAIARHPSAEGVNDLLSLKKTELAKRAAELEVDLSDVDKRANAPVRRAIWAAADDLMLGERPVALDGEGAKQVWSALQPFLPTFALFKSDRASTDQDAEAQDPLKAAIKEAVKAVEPQLLSVKEHVEAEVRKIAAATVEKLREMDPSVAETLDPVITTKSWESLFTTSITGDEGIPLNKRGSGVKRLVLLNFFRAKAERDAADNSAGSIIYAIEEPETSQHPHNQRLLLNALRDLAVADGKQVILTTHTPMLARYLNEADLRFIQKGDDGQRTIREGGGQALATEISQSLGVLPDHNVKVFIGVEGPHDITFLLRMSAVLRSEGEDVPDLEKLELDGELIFVPLGGSNLALWTSRLRSLNRPEFHLCDRDNPLDQPPKYQDFMAEVNAREGCQAVATQKRELENYLHHEAIQEAYAQNGMAITLAGPFADFDDVPQLVAQALNAAHGQTPWEELGEKKQKKKESSAKRVLNDQGASLMTSERLSAVDPNDEVRGWFREIASLIAAAER